ncbi:hypothetical protein [Bacillus paramobilis]|uniref:hypothetical protein n=1 Tax=Bacillus paramobilis TaxID=2817477 RepID=UPI001BB45DBB|nr:hypothetical protein [Bacillus paramobilis]HEF5065802.1 hypothetical protein [Bacillus cereus]HEF5237786.1 hypothetical protein [Bacillus cereus]
MSLFTATGEQAKESAKRKNVDLKAAYIRLKENESVRVRVLGLTDYVEYMAHGEFNLGIYTQPCTKPLDGKEDPLCVAANSGIEGFEKLKAKKRYIFALWDIDKKEVRFWDATKAQATKMIGDIEEYKEDLADVAFNFKRVGTKTETVFSLNPILRLDATGKEGFEAGNEAVIEMADYEAVLIPRTPEQQIEALKQAGFPVHEFFTVGEGSEPTSVDLSKGEENPLEEM